MGARIPFDLTGFPQVSQKGARTRNPARPHFPGRLSQAKFPLILTFSPTGGEGVFKTIQGEGLRAFLPQAGREGTKKVENAHPLSLWERVAVKAPHPNLLPKGEKGQGKHGGKV